MRNESSTLLTTLAPIRTRFAATRPSRSWSCDLDGAGQRTKCVDQPHLTKGAPSGSGVSRFGKPTASARPSGLSVGGAGQRVAVEMGGPPRCGCLGPGNSGLQLFDRRLAGLDLDDSSPRLRAEGLIHDGIPSCLCASKPARLMLTKHTSVFWWIGPGFADLRSRLIDAAPERGAVVEGRSRFSGCRALRHRCGS